MMARFELYLDPPPPSDNKKREEKSWTPSEKTFWIRACIFVHLNSYCNTCIYVVPIPYFQKIHPNV